MKIEAATRLRIMASPIEVIKKYFAGIVDDKGRPAKVTVEKSGNTFVITTILKTDPSLAIHQQIVKAGTDAAKSLGMIIRYKDNDHNAERWKHQMIIGKP